MTTTVIAGALLGAATAPAAAHLAALTARQRIDHRARLWAALVMLAAAFGGVTAALPWPPRPRSYAACALPAAAAATVDAHERRLPHPLTAALAVVVAAHRHRPTRPGGAGGAPRRLGVGWRRGGLSPA